MITADSTRESVHAFAQAVRDALTDLPADEVDELTDGLEADLFERAEELGGTDGFGDPVVYADELRASAGLPERAAAAAHRAGMRELRDGWVAAAAAFWRQTVATPFAREVTRAALALRPVWWVLRGWTVYQVFALAIWGAYSASVVPLGLGGAGKNALRWLLLIAIVLISVQWGRGRWMPGRWAKYLLGLVSIGTVIAVIPVLGIVFGAEQSMMRGAEYASSVAASQPGIVDNGRTVYNIYAYDADGNPLTNVQLYDQDGNPLVAAPDESTDTVPGVNHYGEAFTAMPNPLASGALGWAVYPLPTKAAPQSPPFPAAPRLNAATTGSQSADDGASDASGQPTPTPTALRTPGKDAAASPTPTPTPAG